MFAACWHLKRRLARAEARAGVIPTAAADEIEAACRGPTGMAGHRALFAAANIAGTPAIPLVEMLTEHVPEAVRGLSTGELPARIPSIPRWYFRCETVSNSCVERLFDAGAEASTLARRHRHTLMPGRTLLQQALPITFGLKAARWLGWYLAR